jgi:hypothetical protein
MPLPPKPTLIETLIGNPVMRRDDKRLTTIRRPLPITQRELLELFAALGDQTSLSGFFESTDFSAAEPRIVTFIVLGRWPTAAEIDAIETPYNPRGHMRRLLLGREFRISLVHHVCQTFPERQRLLHVAMPRAATFHLHETLRPLHPIVPPDLTLWDRPNEIGFLPALGSLLGRFTTTRTLLIAQTSIQPFMQPSPPIKPDSARAASGLAFLPSPPLRRPADRLFTILREPASMLVSQINARLAALQADPEGDDPATATWRTRLTPLPHRTSHAAWRQLGLKLLAENLLPANPICHALGDGTAEGALATCRHADIEITNQTLYPDFVKYTFNLQPEPPTNTSLPILTVADIPSDILADRLCEDLTFYERLSPAFSKLAAFKTFLRGRDL